jgi:hypothetical protein
VECHGKFCEGFVLVIKRKNAKLVDKGKLLKETWLEPYCGWLLMASSEKT